MSASDSDEALISRYARGEVVAFEELYRRHELRVWRYLERNVRNRATSDELMQEVWFAVAREAPRYKPTAKFTTWLFTIAHNRMIDAFRTSSRQIKVDTLESGSDERGSSVILDQQQGPLAAAMSLDQAAALTHALSQLPGEQREAFLLQAEADLSLEDIAMITHVNFETAKSRLRYARSKLRELLQEYA